MEDGVVAPHHHRLRRHARRSRLRRRSAQERWRRGRSGRARDLRRPLRGARDAVPRTRAPRLRSCRTVGRQPLRRQARRSAGAPPPKAGAGAAGAAGAANGLPNGFGCGRGELPPAGGANAPPPAGGTEPRAGGGKEPSLAAAGGTEPWPALACRSGVPGLAARARSRRTSERRSGACRTVADADGSACSAAMAAKSSPTRVRSTAMVASSSSPVGADLDDQAGLADHDLVAVLQPSLVALLSVDERAGRRAEIDDVDLIGSGHFDHRVHARGDVVLQR